MKGLQFESDVRMSEKETWFQDLVDLHFMKL